MKNTKKNYSDVLSLSELEKIEKSIETQTNEFLDKIHDESNFKINEIGSSSTFIKESEEND